MRIVFSSGEITTARDTQLRMVSKNADAAENAIGLVEKAYRFLANPRQVAAISTFLVALMALPNTEPGSMS